MRDAGTKQRKEWIDSVTSGSNKCHRENERLGKVISSAVGSCFQRGGHCVTAPPDWQGRLFFPSPILCLDGGLEEWIFSLANETQQIQQLSISFILFKI